MMLLAKALLVCCFTILAELSVIEGKEVKVVVVVGEAGESLN